MGRKLTALAAAGFGCAATVAIAQQVDWGARPAFAEDGTVTVPSFELPPSVFSSKEAQAFQAMRAKMGDECRAQICVEEQLHATELTRRSRAAANARLARISSLARSGKSLRSFASVMPPARYSSTS